MDAETVYDYIIIGSGFGGSVSAMRLTEKGYRVLVLERGKRFRDEDFPKTNWTLRKYLWLPVARCFGILQISLFRHVVALHGSGVGGGSLGYANVLMQPTAQTFAAPEWHTPIDWGVALAPHYETAKRMLGVTVNPRLTPADLTLRQIAEELGRGDTFQPVAVGVYFGAAGVEAPDPYFGGEGLARRGCIHCGGCMVGCRHNAKNTLVKNYLYFAEKWGARIRPETEVRDLRPLADQPDGAHYEVIARSSTRLVGRDERLRARHVIVSAGALGTLRLLFRCRDVTKSLAKLSPRLGDNVRTNSEALLGSTARAFKTDYSQGVAITSIFHADAVTTIEPVRYSAGSSLLKWLAAPLTGDHRLGGRLGQALGKIIRELPQIINAQFGGHWAQRSTILLAMQNVDNRVRMRLGRSPLTLFRRGLVSQPDEQALTTRIAAAQAVAQRFALMTDGYAQATTLESLFNIPMTAHILGGVPFGADAAAGVIAPNGEVYGYAGLYVIDGSILPGNPGINPSLTITALAEYLVDQIPPKPGAVVRPPLMVTSAAAAQTSS